MKLSAGAKFRQAVKDNDPLRNRRHCESVLRDDGKELGSSSHLFVWWRHRQCVLVYFDLGITALNDVLVDVERITNALMICPC